MQDVKTDRYKYIGGSDIPIIMGISHFKSRYDLLLEKAQLKEDDFEGNEYTEYGNIMEPKIRQYINVLFKRNFKEDKLEKEDIRCHFDGIDNDMILEIKTTSQVHDNILEYEVYLVQLLFYMMSANIRDGLLVVYSRPDDFSETFDSDRLQIFNVNIDNYQELCKEINEAVEQFRIDLKKLKENPFMEEQDLVSHDVVEVANQVIALENQLKLFDELSKKRDKLKKDLKELMEKNNIKKWETPNGTKITLVEDTPDKLINEIYFDETQFALENPEVHDKYLKNKEVIKKGKSGYVKITLGGNND